MNFSKYKYNYILMAIPLLICSIFVPAAFIAFLVCIFCGFEERHQ
ncbi:hypothetical protein [Staphylococcus shinii]|nr:hypothetical protein [Staphylococcus shinii]MDW8570035.1 hypothetical protein [Staphylococcus shinii]